MFFLGKIWVGFLGSADNPSYVCPEALCLGWRHLLTSHLRRGEDLLNRYMGGGYREIQALSEQAFRVQRHDNVGRVDHPPRFDSRISSGSYDE